MLSQNGYEAGCSHPYFLGVCIQGYSEIAFVHGFSERSAQQDQVQVHQGSCKAIVTQEVRKAMALSRAL